MRISSYESKKLSITNLKLGKNKNLCGFYYYFSVVVSIYNDVILSGKSKYICLYNFNTIDFEFYAWFPPQSLCLILNYL